jgi:hypothetical protein
MTRVMGVGTVVGLIEPRTVAPTSSGVIAASAIGSEPGGNADSAGGTKIGIIGKQYPLVVPWFGFLCGPLRISAASASNVPSTAENAKVRRGPQRRYFKLGHHAGRHS